VLPVAETIKTWWIPIAGLVSVAIAAYVAVRMASRCVMVEVVVGLLMAAGLGLMTWAVVRTIRVQRLNEALQRELERLKKEKDGASGSLEILKCQVDSVLLECRHLDHDYREEVAFPFHPHSTPEVDDQWTFIHVRLYVVQEKRGTIIGPFQCPLQSE
jgi:hypothetical protein